ncbi:MAG: hypothetical protein SWN10_14025, partial [Pseudomonadota bacterium]|nr:hypothetical protein [Pseudomonadota bacterium]
MTRTSIVRSILSVSSLFTFSVLANTTGNITFINGNSDTVRSYQRGDVVAVQLRDADLNTDSAQAETVAVLVTSNTEDTG